MVHASPNTDPLPLSVEGTFIGMLERVRLNWLERKQGAFSELKTVKGCLSCNFTQRERKRERTRGFIQPKKELNY